MPQRLDGKIALVTGAASGFGLSIAQHFADEGARAVLVDINETAVQAAADQIGAGTVAVTADVTSASDIARAVSHARDRFDGLDIVVNNAGTTHDNKPMTEVSEAEFDQVFAVNVKAIYHMAVHAIPALEAGGGGAILNVSSTAGIRPRPGLTWYNASKGAVNTMTKSMAVELAPLRIRVNALAPVAGETPLLARFLGEDTPERRAQFRATIPWGRFSQPQDIASAAVFLCSDEADMITGSVLEVDGGRCV